MGLIGLTQAAEILSKHGWVMDNDDKMPIEKAAYDHQIQVLYIVTADSFIAYKCPYGLAELEGRPAYGLRFFALVDEETVECSIIQPERMTRQETPKSRLLYEDDCDEEFNDGIPSVRRHSVPSVGVTAPIITSISLADRRFSANFSDGNNICLHPIGSIKVDGKIISLNKHPPITVVAK